jgi:hypothetical protein
MTAVSPRLRRRITLDFPSAGSADEVERMVAGASGHERVQAAIVFWAGGDLDRLRDSVALAAIDRRDVLVRGGLADGEWGQRLDAELGPGT